MSVRAAILFSNVLTKWSGPSSGRKSQPVLLRSCANLSSAESDLFLTVLFVHTKFLVAGTTASTCTQPWSLADPVSDSNGALTSASLTRSGTLVNTRSSKFAPLVGAVGIKVMSGSTSKAGAMSRPLKSPVTNMMGSPNATLIDATASPRVSIKSVSRPAGVLGGM